MSTFRKERMGEAIRQVVSEKMSRGPSLIPNALVTINRVDISADFGVAKIFYSIFGSEIEENEAQKLMKAHQAEFRFEMSRKLNLRHTPQVLFCLDKNIEYAARIENLLKE